MQRSLRLKAVQHSQYAQIFLVPTDDNMGHLIRAGRGSGTKVSGDTRVQTGRISNSNHYVLPT